MNNYFRSIDSKSVVKICKYQTPTQVIILMNETETAKLDLKINQVFVFSKINHSQLF